jgi:hypothetical protein
MSNVQRIEKALQENVNDLSREFLRLRVRIDDYSGLIYKIKSLNNAKEIHKVIEEFHGL